MNFFTRFSAAALLALCGSVPLSAASGALTVVVRDAITTDPLDQADGSNVNDYDQYSLNLVRAGTSHIFSDGAVDSGSGYKVSAWATNYYERSNSSISISGDVTTVVYFNLYHPTLSLSFSPTSATEGGSLTGTVTLLNQNGVPIGKVHNSLTINLSSSNTNRATVPASITIPSMGTSGNFTVSAVDDALVNGNANVTITATCGSWGSDDGIVTILDND
jgi:hypothetical protein